MSVPAVLTAIVSILLGVLPGTAWAQTASARSERGGGDAIQRLFKKPTKAPAQPKPQDSPAPKKEAPDDSGTAAATARIAAGAGFIDVVGVKLGMPMKDAIAALKAHNAALTIQPESPSHFDVLPDKDLIPGIRAGTPYFYYSQRPKMKAGDSSGEAVLLSLSLPPSDPIVWQISRVVSFETSQRPTLENVVAGLRQKYGDPSLPQLMGVSTYSWIFDGQGRQMSGQEAQQADMRCSSLQALAPWAQSPLMLNLDMRDSAWGQTRTWMERGFDEGMVRDPACRNLVRVHALVWVEQPGNTVRSISLGALSVPLARSAFDASHAMLVQAIDDRDKKRHEEASKQAVPTF